MQLLYLSTYTLQLLVHVAVPCDGIDERADEAAGKARPRGDAHRVVLQDYPCQDSRAEELRVGVP